MFQARRDGDLYHMVAVLILYGWLAFSQPGPTHGDSRCYLLFCLLSPQSWQSLWGEPVQSRSFFPSLGFLREKLVDQGPERALQICAEGLSFWSSFFSKS